MTAASHDVVRFADPRCREVAYAGGKGASLARMAELGLAVPPGFAVPAGALVAALPDGGAELRALLPDADATAAERAQALVGGLELPAQLHDAIAAAYAELGADVAVAVRSSACAEDSETASFAGQQETYLHVRGADDVVRRVRDCWASFFTERALFYRSRKGSLDDLDMAVVVQRMVDADVAGVLFTIDPARGRRDRMVVEAVFGLGEAVVSGQVTPDQYVLARDGRVKRETLTTQPHAVVRDDGGGVPEEPLSPDAAAPARLPRALAELAAIGRDLQERLACRRTSSGRSRTAGCSCSRPGRSPRDAPSRRAVRHPRHPGARRRGRRLGRSAGRGRDRRRRRRRPAARAGARAPPLAPLAGPLPARQRGPLRRRACARPAGGRPASRGRCAPGTTRSRRRPGTAGPRAALGDRPVVSHDDEAVRVAAQVVDRPGERAEALEHLHGQRAGGDVAADHDGVRRIGLQLGDHGIERRPVAVDVVQRGDAAHHAVTGRAWSTNSRPSSIAHSMSCGTPSRSCRSRPIAASSASCSSASVRAPPRSGLSGSSRTPPARRGPPREAVSSSVSRFTRPVAREHVLVRRHLAGDDRLAEPEDGLHDHPVAAPARRVDREQHPGDVGVDHALHDDGHVEVVERSLARAVEQRPLGEERRPAVAHAAHDVVGAADVQVRLLLAREARGLGVLGARARPHRDGDVGAQLGVRRRDRIVQLRGELEPADERLRALGGRRVRVREQPAQLRAAVGQRRHERAGGHGEAGRDGQAELGHAGERGALAAGARDLAAARVGEPHDLVGRRRHRRALRSATQRGRREPRRRERRQRALRDRRARRGAQVEHLRERRGRGGAGPTRAAASAASPAGPTGSGPTSVLSYAMPAGETASASGAPASTVAPPPPSSSARQSANWRISLPDTSCMTPRPNCAAGPVIARLVSTRRASRRPPAPAVS